MGSKTLRQCHVSEVTGQGATIISQSNLPERFQLFLASDEKTGRSCRAVARSGPEVRVEFLN